MTFSSLPPSRRLLSLRPGLQRAGHLVILVALLATTLGITACDSADDGAPLQKRWSFAYQEAHVPKTIPLVYRDHVIATAGTTLVKLKLRDGAVTWQRGVTDRYTLQTRSLTTDGDRLYTGHIRDFRAYNLATGDLAWKQEVDGTDIWTIDQIGYFAPVGDLFLAGGHDAELYAFEAATGQLRYRKEFGKGSPAAVIPTGSDQKVYLARAWNTARDPGRESNSMDGRLTEFNPVTGDTTWSLHTWKGGFYAPPILDDGVIYGAAAGVPGIVMAVDATDGFMIWQQEGIGDWAGSVALDDNTLYVYQAYALFAFDRDTGAQRWVTHFDGFSDNDIVLHDGLLYVARNAALTVVDAASGDVLHTTPPPDDTFFWHIALADDAPGGPAIIAQTTTEVVAYDAYRR